MVTESRPAFLIVVLAPILQFFLRICKAYQCAFIGFEGFRLAYLLDSAG